MAKQPSKLSQILDRKNESDGGKLLYVPIWSDKLDVAVAKLINSQPNKHEVVPLISRDSEGLYYFENRRYHMKLGIKNEQV